MNDNQLKNFIKDNKEVENDVNVGSTFVLGIVENQKQSVPSIFQGLN